RRNSSCMPCSLRVAVPQSLLSGSESTQTRRATENYKLHTLHNRPGRCKRASCALSNRNGEALFMKQLLPCGVVAGMVLAPMALAQPAPGPRNGIEDRLRLAQVEQAEVLVQQSDVLLASLHVEGVLSSPCSR